MLDFKIQLLLLHCRESVGTGPVVLKAVRVTGAAFASPRTKCYCAPLFSYTHYWYTVSIFKLSGVYNPEAPTWVRRGPCTARRLKAFKASQVWVAGGARTQARRPTGDVVGGLPPEKSRGLRGGRAQRQRTEVGRIRSCCQGWTGLDDCCEEHGPVAPGGREGSGSTRQRLATRGPSSIQRATPARG